MITPNPPAAAPVKRFVIQIKIMIIEIDSKSGIKKRQNADPKKPIELTIFLTFITFIPFLIILSARKPPAFNAKTEIK